MLPSGPYGVQCWSGGQAGQTLALMGTRGAWGKQSVPSMVAGGQTESCDLPEYGIDSRRWNKIKSNCFGGVLPAVSKLEQPKPTPNHNADDPPFNDERSRTKPNHNVGTSPFNDKLVQTFSSTLPWASPISLFTLALNGQIQTL